MIIGIMHLSKWTAKNTIYLPKRRRRPVAVLETVGENAEESGLIMQIELNCSYDIAAEAFEEIEEKYDVMKLNNGSFGGEKLYAFVFGGGAA